MTKKAVLGLRYLITILSAVFRGNTAEAEDKKKYQRSVEDYTAPDVVLVNQNGAKVRLKDLLQADKPVVPDFI